MSLYQDLWCETLLRANTICSYELSILLMLLELHLLYCALDNCGVISSQKLFTIPRFSILIAVLLKVLTSLAANQFTDMTQVRDISWFRYANKFAFLS